MICKEDDLTEAFKIGILSYAKYKARTTAIVRSERKPAGDEPKVWVRSAESAEMVLSGGNPTLLTTVSEALDHAKEKPTGTKKCRVAVIPAEDADAKT